MKEKDLILRFMDWCHDQGPMGGIFFVFVFTVSIVLFSIMVVGFGSLFLSAIRS